MAEPSSFGASSLKKTDEFIEEKKLQQEKVDAENPDMWRVTLETSLHNPEGNPFYKQNRPDFLAQISEERRNWVLQKAHGDCSCPFRVQISQPFEIRSQDCINTNDPEWSADE